MRCNLRFVLWAVVAGLWVAAPALADDSAPAPAGHVHPALSNATILIIRHAEKPAVGNTLTPAGAARAQAYVGYFQHLQLDGQPVKLDHIFCTADSKGSERPRLTVEPLGKALGMPLDNRFKAKDTAALAMEIRTVAHGKTLLICWHHGDIPALLESLGANPASILSKGKWPDAVFGWMIELRYDADGKLHETKLIHENLMPDDHLQAAICPNIQT